MGTTPSKTLPHTKPTTANRKTIGRPRIFDEAEVLEKVLDQFWQHGFDGTSFTHLTQATGLHKGSLYQAFGDKKSLFIKALKHYFDFTYKYVMARVPKDAQALEQLRALLNAIISLNTEAGQQACGCLAVNTMVEMAPEDDDVHALIAAGYAQRVGTLAALLESAQQAGQVKAHPPAPELAEMLCSLVVGLSVSLKNTMDEADARRVLEQFVDLLLV